MKFIIPKHDIPNIQTQNIQLVISPLVSVGLSYIINIFDPLNVQKYENV